LWFAVRERQCPVILQAALDRTFHGHGRLTLRERLANLGKTVIAGVRE
jgi:hypothetical protein